MSELQLAPSMALSTFIIKQCRKFELFPSERTSVLSKADELQVIQYCLACQNKKDNNEFEADSEIVGHLQDKVNKFCLSKIVQLIENFQRKVVEEKKDNSENSLTSSCACNDTGDKEMSVAQEYPAKDENGENTDSLHNSESCIKYFEGSENTELTLEDGDINPRTVRQVVSSFEDYKNISNHCTILDAYILFVKVLLDQKSPLHQFVESSEDIAKLTHDKLDFGEAVQMQVIDMLRQICKLTETGPAGHMNSGHLGSGENGSDINNESPKMSLPQTFNQMHLQSPKTPSAKNAVCSEQSPMCLMSRTPRTPFSQSQKKELQSMFVHDIFRCYLHLLVNSRSQLALARVFNIPERGLDHDAFTHLKHEAQENGLSMYQALSSFMLRIQLGGQGYAPSASHPLMAHVKGLGALLDLTQKLQTIIEEVPEINSACRRVVNVIKNNLIQSKNGKFSRSLVDPVTENIHNTLSSIIQDMNSVVGGSPDRAVCNGGSVLGQRCLRVIRQFLDASALMKSNFDHQLMSDICFSSQTPTRFPSLLTQFRSPAIMDLEDVTEEHEVHKTEDYSKTHHPIKYIVSSALHIDTDSAGIRGDLLLTQGTLSSVEILPSKTIVHPRAGNTDGAETKQSTSAVMATKKVGLANEVSKGHPKKTGSKRCAISSRDQENLTGSPAGKVTVQPKQRKTETQRNSQIADSSPKSSKVNSSQDSKSKSKHSSKSCRRRLLPQVKGQAKITGFFKV